MSIFYLWQFVKKTVVGLFGILLAFSVSIGVGKAVSFLLCPNSMPIPGGCGGDFIAAMTGVTILAFLLGYEIYFACESGFFKIIHESGQTTELRQRSDHYDEYD